MRRLTVDKRVSLIISVAVLAVSLSAIFIKTPYIWWSAAIIFTVAAVITLTFVKKRCILSINKRQVLLITSVSVFLYYFIFFISGLHFEYVSSGRTLSLRLFALAILPIAIAIVTTELVRHRLLSDNGKLTYALTFSIGVLSDIAIFGGVMGINSINTLMDAVGIAFFPAITANILHSYTSKKHGPAPALVYRLTTSLFKYVVPIEPNVSPAITALSLLVLPLLILAFTKLLFEKKKTRATKKPSKLGFILPTIIIIACAALAMLVSCQFRFGILIVGSPSMTGELNKGDAVVYERYDKDELNIGDIIVFTKGGNNRRVIHRIVDIEPINAQNTYITKGDANDDVDSGYVTDSDIIGVIRFKVAYIGYPTIWLHDIFD